jgi:hypothetical protein
MHCSGSGEGRRGLSTRETMMKLWSDLLSTDYGIFSAAVIGGVLVIGFYMHRMIMKKIYADEE